MPRLYCKILAYPQHVLQYSNLSDACLPRSLKIQIFLARSLNIKVFLRDTWTYRFSCTVNDYPTEINILPYPSVILPDLWLSAGYLPKFLQFRRLFCKIPAKSDGCRIPAYTPVILEKSHIWRISLKIHQDLGLYVDYPVRFSNREYTTFILQISGINDCYFASFFTCLDHLA